MMKQRLNGWQRLWVVFCGLYLIAIGVFTVCILPTESEQGRKRLLNSIDLVSRHTAGFRLLEDAGFSRSEIEDYLAKGGKFDEGLVKGRITEQESAETIRTKYYADLSDEEILAQIQAKYLKKVDFTAVEADYQKDMARLRGDRIRLMLYAFLVWCGTSLGLYGFGFSVAWIIREFRNAKIIVMKKLYLALLLGFFLLGFSILSYFFEKTNVISNGILAFTGIIVAWYTYETSLMKHELVTQRRLSLTPSVIIEEKNRKFILSNYGTPAMNIEITGVDLAEYDEFVFPKILFLSPNNNLEIIGKTKSGSLLIDKSLHVYWKGLYGSEFEIKTSIKYSDLTGRRYETLMKVGKGDHEIIHIKEL